MISVVTRAEHYRAAIAELPLRTRRGAGVAGSLVIVAGEPGWVDAVGAAAEAGAAAVVVADPAFAPAVDVRLLADRMRVPVIVERPLLRADIAADARDARARFGARAAHRAIVVDGAAPVARLSAVARDAVGWARELAGQAPSVITADRGLALLQSHDGIAATLCVTATRRPGRGWVRAQVLGEVISEVSVEGRESIVATVTAQGRLIAPTRFESSERLAVRRAVAALEGGVASVDLADLAGDTEAAEAMAAARA